MNRRPSAFLDEIDAINIDKEQDIIHTEHHEQDREDFPVINKQRLSKKAGHFSKAAYARLQKKQDKQTIAKFKKFIEGSAKDVTGLG